MKLSLLTATALLLASVPAMADTTQPTSAGKPEAAKPEDKIVCKRLEAIGTRLGGKRICKKSSEWKEDALRHRDELDREQRQGLPNAG